MNQLINKHSKKFIVENESCVKIKCENIGCEKPPCEELIMCKVNHVGITSDK